MTLTLIEATGQPTNTWLRVSAATGQIESHSDQKWTPIGWRVNLLTEELEFLNGGTYVSTGLLYFEKTGEVVSAPIASKTLKPEREPRKSYNLAPMTRWLLKSHNALFVGSILLLTYAFFGFRAEETELTSPLWPMIASSTVVLVAVYLICRRSSLRAALLFIIAGSVTRGMWVSKFFQMTREDFADRKPVSTQVQKPAIIKSESEQLWDFIKDHDRIGVEEILDQGVDANLILLDGTGQTPLHFASWLGDAEIVRILLAKKANINAIDTQGKTALHHAAESDSVAVVKILLSEGADSYIRAKSGWTALDWVVSMRGETGEIAQMLKAQQQAVSPEVSEKELDVNATKSIQALVKAIAVTTDDSQIAVWRLDDKIIFEAPNQFYTDASGGSISPDGNYVHFGSAKINTNRRAPHVFQMKNKSLFHLGDSTDLVIEAVNASGILPTGRVLDDECFVDVVKWIGASDLLLKAYCRQRNSEGFEIMDFPCIWSLAKNEITFAPEATAEKATMKFFDEKPGASGVVKGGNSASDGAQATGREDLKKSRNSEIVPVKPKSNPGSHRDSKFDDLDRY